MTTSLRLTTCFALLRSESRTANMKAVAMHALHPMCTSATSNPLNSVVPKPSESPNTR